MQFEGGWIGGNPEYPLKIGEGQGAMIGNEFLVVSGFWNNFGAVTKEVYKLNTADANADWVQQDDIPGAEGITHTGFVAVGQKFYICGGFIGGHPGPHVGMLWCKANGLSTTSIVSV